MGGIGRDLLLDDPMTDLETDAGGTFIEGSGSTVLVQDIALRLRSELGSIFFDRAAGIPWSRYYGAEYQPGMEEELRLDLEDQVNSDPRIDPAYTGTEVMKDGPSFRCRVSFGWYDEEDLRRSSLLIVADPDRFAVTVERTRREAAFGEGDDNG